MRYPSLPRALVEPFEVFRRDMRYVMNIYNIRSIMLYRDMHIVMYIESVY